MTSRKENPFPESAAHFKQIGWCIVAATIIATIGGFAVYVQSPTGPLRPTLVQPELAADTAFADSLLGR